MKPIVGHYEKVRAILADERRVIVAGVRAGATSRITVFDHVANKSLQHIEVPGHVLSLAWAGEAIAAACNDGFLRVYDLASAGELRRVLAHRGACHAVTAVKGDRFATVGTEGIVRLWSSTLQKQKEWPISSQALRAVASDPEGEWVAAAGDDAVVRTINVGSGAKREMAGHSGAVLALAFTPRDGRLASAGDDGTIRFWYLAGDVEAEVRGGDETGHAGAILAMLFPPTPVAEPGEDDPVDRVWTAGADGKIKVWRVEDRRRAKTLDCGEKPIHALAFVPSPTPEALGTVFAGGDRRVLHRWPIDKVGNAGDSATQYGHGFDALEQALAGQKPAREAAVKTLASLAEPEALELALKALASDMEPAVRALAARELGERGQRGARAALKTALDDAQPPVRAAAFDALLLLDRDTPIAPLRAALASKFPEVRARALGHLVPLRETSPLVPGLIVERLKDSDASVRLTALEQLQRLQEGSPEPLKTAFERGTPDLKIEALIRAAMNGWLNEPVMAPIVSRALDDADPGVRRTAFALRVLEKRALATVLEPRDEDLGRAIQEILRRLGQIRRGTRETKAPTDDEIRAARAALPGTGNAGTPPEEADLEPLLTAMACRTPDTALRGARGLASLGDARALGALLQLSREADAGLRRESANALQLLPDTRARKRLVWMLDDADAAVRATALEAIAKLEANSPLTVAEVALRSAHEDVRVRGLDRLVKLPAPDPAAEALLADAIEDESAKVRAEAFRTLWAWNQKDPAKALDRALTARFPDVRSTAVRELAARFKEPWAAERLRKTIADRDASVAKLAYDETVKATRPKPELPSEDTDAHLAALASPHAPVKIAGARNSAPLSARADVLRSSLLKLVQDDDAGVRTAALDALDKLVPRENGPLLAGLQSSWLDTRVRAAELLATRHDEAIIEPMRTLIVDKDLRKLHPPEFILPLRQRATSALATLGSPRTKWLSDLLKDEDLQVREQAARGLANGGRRGEEGPLLDALGHADAWVRSWAGDGLSRLGDARALPVLVGNLKNDHLPIRLGAILSFAALGPEGYAGMLKGLEDPSRDVQEMTFAVVLARDLRAYRLGQPPDVLGAALSSQRAEVRFAAARALELRNEPETYLEHLIQMLLPPKPERQGDMRDWPAEEERERLAVSLAESLAGDQPERRYAAAQVLLLQRKPMEWFREAAKAAALRSAEQPSAPDTTPRGAAASDTLHKSQRLRKLFASSRDVVPTPAQDDHARLKRVAYGAYVGLLRQVGAQDDETNRVRRDSIDRIVDLCAQGHASATAAVPALSRALDDANHLVRRQAFAGLKRLLTNDPDLPLSLALASTAADIARTALDELAARGESAKPRIAAALNSGVADVRRWAFELLEKLSPKGSLDPLLAALASDHSDLRLGVVERLASSNDPRVVPALHRAMESDHEDLRLRAAQLLADRKDDSAVPVLAAFLKSEKEETKSAARESLRALSSAAVVSAVAARIDEALTEPDRDVEDLLHVLGDTGREEALEPLAKRFDDEEESVRNEAFDSAMKLCGEEREKRKAHTAIRFLSAAVRSKHADIRLKAANELDFGDESLANDLLTTLFTDRDPEVRKAAVEAYSKRVQEHGAPVAPMQAILDRGDRALMLPAAEAAAAKILPAALRPLLLFVRAGEDDERPRALRALGSLGDARALEEMETIASGGTEDAPADDSMKAAAIEGLGRMANRIVDVEARTRVVDRIERIVMEASDGALLEDAVKGLGWIGGERARARLETVVMNPEEDYDDESIKAALEWLVKMADPHSETAIAKALDHWDEDVQKLARAALEKIFPKDRARVEILCAKSEQSEVSGPALEWLAKSGDPGAVVSMLPELTDEDQRRQIRFGLVKRGSLPAPEVARLLEHDDPKLRQEAASLTGALLSLADQPQSARAMLGAALITAERRSAGLWKQKTGEDRDAEALAWRTILWAAAATGARGIAPAAQQLLVVGDRSAPTEVRREAARALAIVGSAADVETLVAALGDIDVGVRTAAAGTLLKLAPDRSAPLAAQGRPLDPLAFGVSPERAADRRGFGTSVEGWRLRLPALIAKRDATALLEVAKSADAGVKLDAIDALGRVGGDDAIRWLESIAITGEESEPIDGEPSPEIALRRAAFKALKRAKRADARRGEAQFTTVGPPWGGRSA